jgi:hypothetical protein
MITSDTVFLGWKICLSIFCVLVATTFTFLAAPKGTRLERTFVVVSRSLLIFDAAVLAAVAVGFLWTY